MVKERKRLITIVIAAAIVLAVLLAVIVLIALGRAGVPGATGNQQGKQETAQNAFPLIPKNPYQLDDFAYVDGFLTCTADESLVGIDVSYFQGNIDWLQVRQAGVDYVMIRIGRRGYGHEGILQEDKLAQSYYKGAKAAGLLVGGYFFSQAINVEEAREEAQMALRITKDWELDLPIAYDWEYISNEARTAYIDERTLTDCTLAFCRTIEQGGREAMIYVSPWFGNLQLEKLTEYPHWVALYKDEMTYEHRFTMWQYTDSGAVPGIEGQVDLNVYIPE